MALRAGDDAPAFSMPGSDGNTWTRDGLLGQRYVLTFYPKDETAGCVAQVCALRDAWEDFRGAQVQVFGVSRDSVGSHAAFVANRKLPYVLLTDETGGWHKAFDVGRTFGVTNRVSYLVGPDGRVESAFRSSLRPEAHAAKMLAAVKRARSEDPR